MGYATTSAAVDLETHADVSVRLEVFHATIHELAVTCNAHADVAASRSIRFADDDGETLMYTSSHQIKAHFA